MVDKPVIEHVIRRASLPWRPTHDDLTECGKPARNHTSITFDQFTRKLRIEGTQRAALSTCMTCWNTATRYQPWATDPVDAIRREVNGMRTDTATFRHELWAIAAIVDAHRDEFDAYLTGLTHTADLTAHRQAKRRTNR
jgi:hypothetical protein